jgi:hypothetical protein
VDRRGGRGRPCRGAQLRGARLRLRLTRAQSARVIAPVKHRITARGAPAVDVVGIDESAFKPAHTTCCQGSTRCKPGRSIFMVGPVLGIVMSNR